MSFADELKKAEQRLKAQKEQEANKKKPRRVVRTAGGKTKTLTSLSRDDEIIIYYLGRTQASKFIQENYSKKRKLPLRTVQRRMEAYFAICTGKKNDEITPSMRELHQELLRTDDKELQSMVIDILRGESKVKNPPSSPPKAIIRKGDS